MLSSRHWVRYNVYANTYAVSPIEFGMILEILLNLILELLKISLYVVETVKGDSIVLLF